MRVHSTQDARGELVDDFLFWFLPLWIGGTIVNHYVAKAKGHPNPILLSLLLSPIFPYLYLLAVQPNEVVLDGVRVANGWRRKCGHCAELIKPEARVCRHCGRDVEPVIVADAV
jgi:hypothetical protein